MVPGGANIKLAKAGEGSVMGTSDDAAIGVASGEANPSFWRRADDRLAKVEDWLALFAGLGAVGMTGAILYDIVSRIVTNQSIGWGTDLTEMLMFLLTYTAAGYLARHNGHVRVDVLTDHFTARFNMRLLVLTTALSLFFAIILVTQGWNAWLGAIFSGKATMSVHIPQWWFAFFLPVGAFLLVLELVIVWLKQIAAVVADRRAEAGERAAARLWATGAAEGE